MTNSTGVASSLNRRNFLRGAALAAGAVGVAALGGPLLTACGAGGTGAASGAAGGTETVPLPDFTDALQIKPDLPGTADGVQDGFLTPVKEYYPSVSGEIGSGGDVRALVTSYAPPGPPLEQNPWWQAINQRANINYLPEIAPAGDYVTKFGTVTAGNDLPDLVSLPLFLNLPRVADLLRTRFADLSEHLSGSNVNAYPNLAGLPTYAWQMARVNGRIYGVPVSRALFAAPMFVRQDLLDQLGAERPTTPAEFEALCQEITDPKNGRWAMGSTSLSQFNVPFWAQMFGAPMRWGKKPDGTLVKDYETDEYRQAIEYAIKMREAGYFHPDSGTVTQTQATDQFAQGKVVMYMGGLAGWKQTWEAQVDVTPGFKQGALVPFGYDGKKGAQYLDTGIFSLTAIKQADKGRVEEMLRVLNFFAGPYGSEEFLLTNYGVAGVDHTTNEQGLPVLTDQGKLDQGTAFPYLMSGAPVLTSPKIPDYVKDAHAWQKEAVPLGVSDPTNGLYSETNSKVGSQLTTAFLEGVLNITSGRGSINDLPALVAAWKNGGGDTIREELQSAMAAQGNK